METFETLRQEVEVKLRDALAGRPGLLAAVETATRQAHEAAHRFENFALRVARGTRHGQDLVTGAIRQLLDDARRERDRAAAALTLAKRRLANSDWQCEMARPELAQLELVEHPPVEGRGAVYEIAKRKPPPGLDVVSDDIVFPPGKPPSDSAA